MSTLTYLYGVVPAGTPPPPPMLRGIDGAEVRAVDVDGLLALVSEVDEATYSESSLDERTEDLGWVAERALAHEAVLAWAVDAGPVVPTRPFSLHASRERLCERLASEADELRSRLAELSGRKEWGVKLWRLEERFAAHLGELSEPIRAISGEISSATPGRRFLLEKRREQMRTEEVRTASARVAREVYSDLRESSERAATKPIARAAADSGRVLTLHAAFLVPDSAYPDFHRRLNELAARYSPLGFEFEFTGPWPPYHFAEA